MDNKRKILIVDDERFYINLLVDLLREDYKLFIAKTGQQALNRVKDNPPDLILLDIQLPDMDGFDVFETLQEHPIWQFIPVLFLTAASDMATYDKAIQAGASACLNKPIDGEEIQRQVTLMLQSERIDAPFKKNN